MTVPIRLRMTGWYVLLLAIIVGLVGLFLVLRLRSDLTGEIDRSLRPAAAQISSDYSREGVPEFPDSANTVLKGERATAQLVTRRGRVVATFGDRVALERMVPVAEIARALGGATVSLSRTLGSDAQQFRLALRRTRFQGTDRVVVAGQSLQPVERSIRRVAVLLLLACPAALLATAIGGWALARRSLRPVAQMATTAEAIGVDRLSDRLQEPRSRDELAHLASTLNTMLDRVQDGVEEQRRLVADASHELRTPLAAMRSEIDVSLRADDLPPAARDVLASSREEVDGMSRTVDDLLTLAAVDGAALDLRTERVDLAGAAGAVIEGLASLAGRRGVAVEQRGGRVAVLADPLRLAQAVRNVVENAIEFSPEGGTVVVTTSASGRTGLLTVEDAGPGIPAELRARVFERFFRVDASRARATGGSGLGLAITREVVEAQQGRVRAECRAVGAALVIELPAAGVVPARPAATAGSA